MLDEELEPAGVPLRTVRQIGSRVAFDLAATDDDAVVIASGRRRGRGG